MTRLRLLGMCLVPALLASSAQASSAKSHANNVMRAPSLIWTLAMDGPRVAYESAGKIRVWNTATGATFVVKGHYGKAKPGLADATAAQVAIAGNRVAWIKRKAIGNTEASEKLYSATLGGKAHLRARAYRYDRNDPSATKGTWIAGVVGSGGVLAVSTWKSNGTASSHERLRRITATGLKTIASGPGAIVAEAADSGHIAVLRSNSAWPSDSQQPLSPTPTAGIYSSTGALDGEVALTPPDPDTLGIQLALTGKHLVVLTTTLHEPDGPATVTLQIYDWMTGVLLDTWPVRIQKYPGVVTFAAHGQLAAVEGYGSLHLVNLTTGKDVVIGPSSRTGSPPAMDSRGLVYAFNRHVNRPGKLVFVPMVSLLADVS